ncbi:hypothetical protein RJ639_006216 [Escallonia herrerae]|uniref:Uncharacterized protein n=1 Tax=Escallonia herrerae TaxID=1293975 RepID=A0AA89ATG2_9ASTE|nr:hypothetical protein RJ639_006216 [Escallonia herrerae]
MNSKISDAHEAATGESYSSRRPLPKRGQIKSRIAANAVHSLVSVISRASPQRHQYKAVTNSTAEILWVTNLLHELGIILPKTPVLFYDNTGATYLCANPVFHSRMKHIALDYHFVWECVTNGSLRVHHITTKDQLADILTKALHRSQFLHLRSKIGVTNGASILRGRVKR